MHRMRVFASFERDRDGDLREGVIGPSRSSDSRFEVADGRGSRAAALGPAPQVPGLRCPAAWGHRFGSRLCCEWCAETWDAHQLQPRPCPRTPELRAERARTLRERAADEKLGVAPSSETGLTRGLAER